MKKVIVTGASGFIGTTLVNELLRREYNIVAIDRRFTDDFLNNPSITCVDATDKDVFDLKNEIPAEKTKEQNSTPTVMIVLCLTVTGSLLYALNRRRKKQINSADGKGML